jgi:hypothetical protein
MDNCSGCGAPEDPSSLVCRFCGRSCQDLTSAADELRALNDLHGAAQQMGQSGRVSGLFGAMGSNVMNNLGAGPQARIAQFWQNAFIPRTLDAQCQAVIQMISLIVVPEGVMQAMQRAMDPSSRKAESIYFDRADAIMTAMRIHHAGDPVAAPKIAALDTEIERERAKVRSARTRGWILYGVLVGGSLLFLGVAGLLVAIFG